MCVGDWGHLLWEIAMTCRRADNRENRGLGDCCCLHCEEDVGGCGSCCACLSRFLCGIFTPTDGTGSEVHWRGTHLGKGQYSWGAAPFTVNLDNDTCEWRVFSGTLDLDERIDANYTTCGTGLNIVVPGVTIGSVTGTLKIQREDRSVIPLAFSESNPGCFEKRCLNCTCFPRCFCMRYRYGSEGLGDDDELDDDAFRQTVRYCADSGSWTFSFPTVECATGLSVRVFLDERPESRNCGLYLEVLSDPATLDFPVSSGPVLEVDSSFDCFTTPGIAGVWRFGNNTGIPGDPGVQLTLIRSACGDQIEGSPCQECCIFLQETLTCTVTGHEDCWLSSDPEDEDCDWEYLEEFEVVLTRPNCSSLGWIGSFYIDKCNNGSQPCVRPNSPDNILVEITFSCIGCVYQEGSGMCVKSGATAHVLTVRTYENAFIPPVLTDTYVGTHISSSCDPLMAVFQNGHTHDGPAPIFTVTL